MNRKSYYNRNLLSVITVNYNGFDDTCELIVSLERHLSVAHEIIVVDNASKNNEADRLQERFPNVKLIKSPKNLGFAGGNNLGIESSCGDFLLFINNDAYICDGLIGTLIERLSSNSRAGGVSPKIRFAFDNKHIQFAGYTPLSPITTRNALVGFDTKDEGQFDKANKTPFLHGAAMMIKREVIEKVGEMPECYFLYYEELDWSQRMIDAGYDLWYDPIATVYHKESRSTGIDSPNKLYYLTRNRLLFVKRNRTGLIRVLATLYQYTISIPKSIVKYLLKGRIAHIGSILRGAADFLKL